MVTCQTKAGPTSGLTRYLDYRTSRGLKPRKVVGHCAFLPHLPPTEPIEGASCGGVALTRINSGGGVRMVQAATISSAPRDPSPAWRLCKHNRQSSREHISYYLPTASTGMHRVAVGNRYTLEQIVSILRTDYVGDFGCVSNCITTAPGWNTCPKPSPFLFWRDLGS
jgi:hypothetical protein